MHQTYKDNPKIPEKSNFLKQLARQLVEPHMRRREVNLHIPREIKFCIRRVLGIEEKTLDGVEEDILEKRKICSICPNKKRRMTKYLLTFVNVLLFFFFIYFFFAMFIIFSPIFSFQRFFNISLTFKRQLNLVLHSFFYFLIAKRGIYEFMLHSLICNYQIYFFQTPSIIFSMCIIYITYHYKEVYYT